MSNTVQNLSRLPLVAPSDHRGLLRYFYAVAVVALCTIVNVLGIQPYLPLRNVVMIYLLGVVVAAKFFGRGPSALATILSVTTFDFAFVSSTGSLTNSRWPDVITFLVMFAIGLTISTLTGHVSAQIQAAREREERMSALFAMTREFAKLRSQDEIAVAAGRHIGDALNVHAAVSLVDPHAAPPGDAPREAFGDETEDEKRIIDWVIRHNERAGAGTSLSSDVPAIYLPLSAAHDCLGVLRLRVPKTATSLSPTRSDLLKTLTELAAMAIERARWVDAAERARLDTEAERLRNSLLSAVSHDLRTPLAVIVGSSSTLVDLGDQLDRQAQRELAESILDEGNRLNRQVSNLLEMTRLEDGSLRVRKEWQTLDEIAGVVLERLERPLRGFTVRTDLPADLPPVPMDDQLVQQVLVNLLENAIKYAPHGSSINLSAWLDGNCVTIEVADSGPGMSAEVLEHAFDRFYRGPSAAKGSGVGLGLSICKGIVSLHGGRIWAENRETGGLAVRFSLPVPILPCGVAAEVNRNEY